MLNGITCRCVARIFFSLCFLIILPNTGFAADIETILMPGKVIDGHKKWEDTCSKCHKVFGELGQSKLCLACHDKIESDIKKKRGYHGRYSQVKRQECRACHTDHIGRDGDIVKLDKETFDHHLTDFKLKGTHKTVDCRLCHKKKIPYRETKSKCVSCHKKDDPHKKRLGKKYKGKCVKCHQESGWDKNKFDHNKTKFKLKYKHKKVTCATCHPNDRFLKTPKSCYSCHRLNDIHRGGNGKKCVDCHNPRGWKKVKFDHDADTTFKLEGRHKDITCIDCHRDEKDGRLDIKKRKKKKKARQCYSCHKQDDEHKGTFGKKCQTCHGVKNWWVKRKFQHDRDTKFKLKGKHKKADCNDCHRGGNVYKEKLKQTCYTCHKVDDTHKGQQGKKCQTCHNEKGWRTKVKFEHDITNFPLIGLHAITPCEECHLTNSFKDVKIQCFSCHEEDDNHKRTLGENCNKCHNPNDWNLWRFNHDKQTKFKIDGKHKKLICNNCHKTPTKKLQSEPRTCIRCHASDDEHNGSFGNNCKQCHTTESFRDHRR
ncbi:MAG: cytochrome C [Gammaproteobacteria bacterium]